MKERKAENRPVVRPGAVGWILEGAALLVLLADFSFTAWGTFALPEMPPEFFEFRGGGSMASLRAGLWVLPAVALLSYLLLTWLTSIPHRLPYPRPVTDDNRQRLYTTATRMLRVLKLLVVVLYAYDRLGFRSAGHGCLYAVCAGAGCRGDSGRCDYQDGCRPVRIAAVAGMRSAEGRMKEMRGALPLASLLSVIGLSFLFRWFSDAVRQADFVFGNRERRFHPVPGCRIGLIGYALSLCRDGSESASALNPEFPFRLPVSENAGAFRCSNWRPCAELRFRGELCLPGRVFAMGFPCKPARRHEPRLPLPGRRIRAVRSSWP